MSSPGISGTSHIYQSIRKRLSSSLSSLQFTSPPLGLQPTLQETNSFCLTPRPLKIKKPSLSAIFFFETTTNAIHQQSSSSSSSIDWPSFVHPPLSACPVLSCLSILPLFLFSPHLPQPLPTATHPPRKDIVISPSPPPSSSLDSH
ncbi:hypothetical protein PGTUg99_008451 [Puccinia graminis f. sp. tritici]|uniref:Uncharacterized protein n=1 Tax=Puccinia graminis f. sp. tritici TaxID=56615 RepID=A0A5B0LL77_PUCGR|nr:hypothetical protein PGTUg99_008451 [Puccinia graminis f. sp. tritici]